MVVVEAAEVFKEIPGDPDNVIMQIPEEICEQMNWRIGDTLNITVSDGKMSINKNG